MKKKGFTLIELLAVIVVLAIIALIATPIVMNVISNAQKGAAERSADNYVKAVETLIATKRLDGEPVEDGTYTIGTDGNLSFGDVELNGTKPSGGTITIKDGQVVKENASIKVGDYTVTYDDGAAKADQIIVLCKAIAPIQQELYDATTKTMVPTTVGIQATSSAPYAAGAVYSCNLGDGDRTFYVLSSTKDTVSLLMEENMESPATWCATGDDNSCNGDGAIASLNSQTSGWSKLFSVNGKVSLPSYDDMYGVIGDDWTAINLTNVVANNGYWTSTLCDFEITEAWIVEKTDVTTTASVNAEFGIRPVITISTEYISL